MYIADDTAPNTWSPALSSTGPHPHPLRSNTTEELHSIARNDNATSASCQCSGAPPPGAHGVRRSIASYGGDHDNDIVPEVPPEVPMHLAFRTTPANGFSDNTLSTNQAGNDVPAVPMRLWLRPPFGGDYGISYYSLDSLATHTLNQKSMAVAVQEEAQQERQERLRAGRRFYACFAFLCIFSFLGGVNVTALATALPAAANALKIDAVAAFWAASSFPLSAALTQLLAMRLSQASGPKSTLVMGLVLFLIGSATCKITKSFPALIAGRALGGSGYGTISIVSQQINRQVLTGPRDSLKGERPLSATFWLGAAVGPVVGGATAHAVGWNSAHWIGAPFALLALLTLPFLLDLPFTHGLLWTELSHVDYPGWALLAGSLTAILVGISGAGTTYSWTSGHILAPLIIGFVALALFPQYCRTRLNPLIPAAIFRNLDTAVSCWGTVIQGIIFTAIIYTMPNCFALVHGLSPVLTGIALSPWTLVYVVTSIAAAALGPITGRRWTIWLGWLLTAAGTGLVALCNEQTATALCIGFGLIAGFGLGLLSPGLATTTEAGTLTAHETANVSLLHNSFSMLGQAAGIVIGSSVFLNQLFKSMVANAYLVRDARTYTRDAVAWVDTIRLMSADQADLKTHLITAYVDALRSVWIVFCILAGVTFMLALLFTRTMVQPRQRIV